MYTCIEICFSIADPLFVARKHPSYGHCKLIWIIRPDMDLGFQMAISNLR